MARTVFEEDVYLREVADDDELKAYGVRCAKLRFAGRWSSYELKDDHRRFETNRAYRVMLVDPEADPEQQGEIPSDGPDDG